MMTRSNLVRVEFDFKVWSKQVSYSDLVVLNRACDLKRLK